MAHFVFGAPDGDGFALHERLGTELGSRGQRVSVLHTDPAGHLPWRQHETAALLRPRPHATSAGERDLLAALATAGGDARGASVMRLARFLTPLRTWFAAAGADLLLLHRERGPMAQLLQFAALEAGARVVWIGDGLLPHTLQIDAAGLDGDAAATRHSPYHYRVVRADPEFLHTCLVHALAAPAPFAPGLRTPDLWQGSGWRALPGLLRSHGPRAVLRALRSKPDQRPDEAAAIPPSLALPGFPYLAVVLQRDDDPRVRLDAAGATSAALLAASSAASRSSGLPLVIVPSPGDSARQLRALRQRRHIGTVVARAAAPAVVAAAAATLTINDPLAAVALLAGTPVLHAGRALYGLRGVTTQAPLREFPEALVPSIAARDHATLRARFLTWLFQNGHVWCSAKAPDHNGMLGLVQTLTGRFSSTRGAPPSRYRIGPPWPLANPRRD